MIRNTTSLSIDRYVQAILECYVEYTFDDLVKKYDTQLSTIKIVKLSSTGELEAITTFINGRFIGDYAISKYRETVLHIPISLYKNDVFRFHGNLQHKVIVGFCVRINE